MLIGQRLFKARPDLVQHRYRLGQQLSEALNGTVAYGPFTGTRLALMNHWSAADRGGMLLGMYEKEILEQLEILSRGREVLIDVGAADGYYAVGSLASGMFESAICFEVNPDGQEMIRQQAKLNGVCQQVTVLGEANTNIAHLIRTNLSADASRCVVLMDIEGGEFELLNDSFLAEFGDASLIVEIHDFLNGQEGALDLLLDRLSGYYDCKFVEQGARNPNVFPELREWSDDDRWALCSESRSNVMRWLVCTPRSGNDY